MYATDGRTDKTNAYCPLSYGRGHNNAVIIQYQIYIAPLVEERIRRLVTVGRCVYECKQDCYTMLSATCQRKLSFFLTGDCAAEVFDSVFSNDVTVVHVIGWHLAHYRLLGALFITYTDSRNIAYISHNALTLV